MATLRTFIAARRKTAGGLLLLTALVAGVAAWLWASAGAAASTDNAYVRGDITSLAPKVAGYLTAVEVADKQEIGRAHIFTPVTHSQLICRRLLEKYKQQ